MARGLVAFLNTIAPVAAINNAAIMRTLKVVLMAGVIIGAGVVVVPVSEAQAQKPTVTLEGIPSHVTLGHSFDFTIRAEPAPASNIVTNLALTYGLDEDFEDVGTTFTVTDSNGMAITLVNGKVPITIPTTSGVVELKIVTDAALAQQTSVDIGTPAAFFTNKIQLDTGTEFDLAQTSGVEFGILNNLKASEARPKVSLQSYSTTPVPVTTTSSNLTFNIIASHMPTTAPNVNVELSQTGDFLASTTINPVELSTTQTTTPFTVAVIDKDALNEAGQSTITVDIKGW